MRNCLVLVVSFAAVTAMAQPGPKAGKPPAPPRIVLPGVVELTPADVKNVMQALPQLARWAERMGQQMMPERLVVLVAGEKLPGFCKEQAVDCPTYAARMASVLGTYTTLRLEKMRAEIMAQAEPMLKDPNLSESHKELIRKSAEAPFADPVVQQVAALATPGNRAIVTPFVAELEQLFKRL